MGSDMSDKIRVEVSFEGRWVACGVYEISKAQYEEFCAKLDAWPRGYDKHRLAEQIFDALNIDFRDGEVEDLEVDDFYSLDNDGAQSGE